MECWERIQLIMDREGLNKNSFSKQIGLSSNVTITRLINERRDASPETCRKIVLRFPQYNYEWVLKGEGEMLNNNIPIHNEVTPVPEGDYMMVEYVDLRASAGVLGVGDVAQLPDTHKRLVPKEYAKGGFLVVRVDGDSMDDGTKKSLSDGDEVLIYEHVDNHIENLPIRKTLFVITTLNGNVLKQIKEINKEEGYILCHSFNQGYEDFKIKFDDVCQIFIVCKIVNKQISLA